VPLVIESFESIDIELAVQGWTQLTGHSYEKDKVKEHSERLINFSHIDL
jgi:hypothetical protein